MTGDSKPLRATAELFDGVSARPRRLGLTLELEGLRLAQGRQVRRLAWSAVQPRLIDGGWVRLELPDGQWAQLHDPAVQAWLEGQGRLQRPWSARPGLRAALLASVAAALLAAVAVLGLGWGLDPLLDRVIAHLPANAEKNWYKGLESAVSLHADRDPARAKVLDHCARLVARTGERRPRVLLIDDAQVNAFALPGGLILLHRGLLLRLHDQAELFALLGHENAHLRQRHALRQLLRNASSSVLLALIFGRGDGLSSLMVENGSALAQLRFSRSEEQAADDEALEVLQRLGLDPRGGSRLMRELLAAGGGKVPEILSTHPDTLLRADRLSRLAAMQPAAQRNGVLSAAEWRLLRAGKAPVDAAEDEED